MGSNWEGGHFPHTREHTHARQHTPARMTASHLWLAHLEPDVIAVFAVAFTLSAKKRGYRVSTERFLAALPEKYKEMVARLCEGTLLRTFQTQGSQRYAVTTFMVLTPRVRSSRCTCRCRVRLQDERECG